MTTPTTIVVGAAERSDLTSAVDALFRIGRALRQNAEGRDPVVRAILCDQVEHAAGVIAVLLDGDKSPLVRAAGIVWEPSPWHKDGAP